METKTLLHLQAEMQPSVGRWDKLDARVTVVGQFLHRLFETPENGGTGTEKTVVGKVPDP